MSKMLSVCMIVKNEEKVLERCLNSIIGIADEIIVIDTGSQDKSKEIASNFTKKVFDFEWEDDFSKARNYAASKATGEWILAVDADEYVDPDSFKIFKKRIAENPPEQNILGVQIVSFVGKNGKETVYNYHERLYKNDGKIAYYRPIHELLYHKNSNENKGTIDFQLYHTGYMSNVKKEKNKSERNLSLLLEKEEKDPIDYFFIGNEFKSKKDYDKAIKNYQKGYNLIKDIRISWVKTLLINLIDSLHKTGQNNAALDLINSCEKIYSGVADFKYFKGMIYFNMKEIKKSRRIFEEILSQRTQLTAHMNKDFIERLPFKYLADIYEEQNEPQKAVQSYSEALSINDSDDALWGKLVYLLAKHSTLKELTDFINNNIVSKETMTPQRIVKILLSIPLLNIQKLSRSLLNERELSESENQALLIKNYHLDGQTDDVVNIIGNTTPDELFSILKTGIYNIQDMIIITMETKNIKFQEVLFKIKFDESLENLLNMIFYKKNKKLTMLEENIFISLYRQAMVLDTEEVLIKLRGKRAFLSKENREKIIELKVENS